MLTSPGFADPLEGASRNLMAVACQHPALIGDSTIVAATEWRQHVAVDVSLQNRFALRIKATKWRQARSLSPLRGFPKLGSHFLWTCVHSYTLSPLSWLVCRTQGKVTAVRSLSQSPIAGEADSCGSTLPTIATGV